MGFGKNWAIGGYPRYKGPDCSKTPIYKGYKCGFPVTGGMIPGNRSVFGGRPGGIGGRSRGKGASGRRDALGVLGRGGLVVKVVMVVALVVVYKVFLAKSAGGSSPVRDVSSTRCDTNSFSFGCPDD